ncbi:MAG TPA: methyltransferase domain-containing protein [Stellaceae bacterium]|nr:methyltransferase domain-containing protein [Stellaceae bacterium]
MSDHRYSAAFFRYIEPGSRRSAQRVIPVVRRLAAIDSVLDVGCGRGLWLAEWRDAGVDDIVGVDGGYVGEALAIPKSCFIAHDLGRPFRLRRSFDLVQSLEVAEHVPAAAADLFVDNLTAHGKTILFSAAVPGQGGEGHVNEQPYEYWRDKFAARGYGLYDACRPALKDDRAVEPWYRYNLLLFIHDDLRARLSPALAASQIGASAPVPRYAPFAWRLRTGILKHLPPPVVSRLARLKHRVTIAARRLGGGAR